MSELYTKGRVNYFSNDLPALSMFPRTLGSSCAATKLWLKNGWAAKKGKHMQVRLDYDN